MRPRQALDAPGAALIRLAAVAARPDGTARANRATICAVDQRFWQLGPNEIDPGRIGPKEVILNDALAYMECRLHSSYKISDHLLFVGEVVGGQLLSDDPPYVHLRKSGFSY